MTNAKFPNHPELPEKGFERRYFLSKNGSFLSKNGDFHPKRGPFRARITLELGAIERFAPDFCKKYQEVASHVARASRRDWSFYIFEGNECPKGAATQ